MPLRPTQCAISGSLQRSTESILTFTLSLVLPSNTLDGMKYIAKELFLNVHGIKVMAQYEKLWATDKKKSEQELLKASISPLSLKSVACTAIYK